MSLLARKLWIQDLEMLLEIEPKYGFSRNTCMDLVALLKSDTANLEKIKNTTGLMGLGDAVISAEEAFEFTPWK